MKYKLEKNPNGTVTQVINADGGSVYDLRPELRKLNQEALERPTPGKLGELGNLGVVNFSFTDTAWPSQQTLIQQYNTSNTTGGANFLVMFSDATSGPPAVNSKANYYNIKDIKCDVQPQTNVQLRDDSYVQFYLLRNIDGSNTPAGQKIPAATPIFTNDTSATFNFFTGGSKEAYQYISVPIIGSSNPIATNSDGLRCSGIALKTVCLNSVNAEDWSTIRINVIVNIDISSVSSTY